MSGNVEIKSGVSLRASVQHTGGWTWEGHWVLVTKYLSRLQEIHGGAEIESNTDLWAIVNSFMIDACHLAEAFAHEPGLATKVRATVRKSPHLLLCRDYANTWKHFRRDKNVRIAHIWEEGDSPGAGGGHYVAIGHRLRDDPTSNQILVDALAVVRGAWEAWRSFMLANGRPEPTGITQPYIDRLAQSGGGGAIA